VKLEDAAEVQALIAYHAAIIVSAITDGGIKPSKQHVLVKTCMRMAELASGLADFPVA